MVAVAEPHRAAAPTHRYVHRVGGVRQTCGHGKPHPLTPPRLEMRAFDAAYKFAGGCRCVGCGRIFMTPTVRVPHRLMLTRRGPSVIQAHLTAWAMRWLAHEAARP